MTIISSKMTWTQSQMLVILVSGLCIQSAAISKFIFYGLFISKTEKCISITKCSISGPEELLNWLIPISALRIRREKSETEERGGARGDTGIYRIEVTFTWASGMLIGSRGCYRYQAFHVHCTLYNIVQILRFKKITKKLKKRNINVHLVFPQFSAWYPIAAPGEAGLWWWKYISG